MSSIYLRVPLRFPHGVNPDSIPYTPNDSDSDTDSEIPQFGNGISLFSPQVTVTDEEFDSDTERENQRVASLLENLSRRARTTLSTPIRKRDPTTVPPLRAKRDRPTTPRPTSTNPMVARTLFRD